MSDQSQMFQQTMFGDSDNATGSPALESGPMPCDSGATGGFWANCEWWYGRDGKWRPIEPGLQPLVAGSAKDIRCDSDPSLESVANSPEARVLRLRGYGDSIVAEVAAEFIKAYSEVVSPETEVINGKE